MPSGNHLRPGGLAIARSILTDWVGICGVRPQSVADALRAQLLKQPVLHADETPVAMLAPGNKKTHRAYVWAYYNTPFSELKATAYDFVPSRVGEHARAFLGDWHGKLVCDDYAGYKAGFDSGITEIGCLAHARRKFHVLHVTNKSELAAQALESIGARYGIERVLKDPPDQDRQRLRREKAQPIADALDQWMIAQRQKVPGGPGTAKALDYSLKRWAGLTC